MMEWIAMVEVCVPIGHGQHAASSCPSTAFPAKFKSSPLISSAPAASPAEVNALWLPLALSLVRGASQKYCNYC